MSRRTHDRAKDQASRDVHRKRAVWKDRTGESVDDRRQSVAADGSESATDRNQYQLHGHSMTGPVDYVYPLKVVDL
jgi:hypothetical protein